MLIEKDIKNVAKEKALQWCSRREYCRKEISDKLVSWGCSSVEACEVVDFLVEQKFIDERRYTEAFAKDKLRFNKWGRVKIAYMLRNLNVDSNMVMDVLSEIDETEYQRILTGELHKKYKTLRGNIFEINGKLYRFAIGRGFESSIVNEIITRLHQAKD